MRPSTSPRNVPSSVAAAAAGIATLIDMISASFNSGTARMFRHDDSVQQVNSATCRFATMLKL